MKLKFKANNSSGKQVMTLWITRGKDSHLTEPTAYITITGNYNGKPIQLDFEDVGKKRLKKIVKKLKKISKRKQQ